MNFFIIKMISGTRIKITEKQYRKIRNLNEGIVHLSSGKSFNLSSVDSIVPEKDYYEQKRKKENRGVLHDGTRVIRYFGRWYLDNGVVDERGRPESIIDPAYYPEVNRDCVPTIEEYKNKYKELPKQERLKLIVGENTSSRKKRENEGLVKLIKAQQ